MGSEDVTDITLEPSEGNACLLQALRVLPRVLDMLPKSRPGLTDLDYTWAVVQAMKKRDGGNGRRNLLYVLLVVWYNAHVYPKLKVLGKKPRRMSVTRLAERMGLSRARVSDLLNGKASINRNTAHLLAEATCDWLESTAASWMMVESVFPAKVYDKEGDFDCLHVLLGGREDKPMKRGEEND